MSLRRISASMILLLAALMPCSAGVTMADNTALAIVNQARAAIGGATKLAAITSLEAAGKFSRLMGDQTVTGEIQVSMMLPGRYKQDETTSLMGGVVQMTRTNGL